MESGRRRALTKILRGETEKGRFVRFCVVSEPSDSEPELECEEVGAGTLDLVKLDRDLVDHRVQIRDTKDTLVSSYIYNYEVAVFRIQTRIRRIPAILERFLHQRVKIPESGSGIRIYSESYTGW